MRPALDYLATLAGVIAAELLVLVAAAAVAWWAVDAAGAVFGAR